MCGEESGGDGVVSGMVEDEVGYACTHPDRIKIWPCFHLSSVLVRLHFNPEMEFTHHLEREAAQSSDYTVHTCLRRWCWYVPSGCVRVGASQAD